MTTKENVSDELIIVGGRYGDLADRLKLLFEQEMPIEGKDVKEKLGGNLIYLMPTYNKRDPYAVGVYTTTKKQIGFLWTYQAYAMRQWMDANKVDSVKARICKVSTKYGFMVSTPLKPLKLEIKPYCSMAVDLDWASHLPEVSPTMKNQSLNVGMLLLYDALTESETWNDSLRNHIENLLEDLAYDLSAQHYEKCMELYYMMKGSVIVEVREYSDKLLYTLIDRGSTQRMKWWMENCLHSYFRDVREGSLLKIYKVANYTLERVEELLHDAPGHLFHIYEGNRDDFAAHLYYAALPPTLYNRLLTLLAVREAMMAENNDADINDEEGLSETDIRIRNSCVLLQEEGVLRKKSDWGLIMTAMNQTESLPHHDTPRSFVKYFHDTLLVKDVPSESTVSKMVGKIRGMFPAWKFDDTDDNVEVNRRVNVSKRFISAIRKMT